MVGPAFVAAIAYIDPGNFATNFSAGASYGYRLFWVVIASNSVAVLIQFLSAKLGVATGRDLATICRDEFSRPVTVLLWLQAEAVAVATDLAEVVGGAVALRLLLGVPLVAGGVLTALTSIALLRIQNRSTRRFEAAIIVILLACALAFGYLLSRTGASAAGLAGGLLPGFAGNDSVLLATGMLGATVMPHVVFVHSALTSDRYRQLRSTAGERRAILRVLKLDVLLAMGVAGLMNAAMLVIAAQGIGRHRPGASDTLVEVHSQLGQRWGPSTAAVFAVALLLSGVASTAVGAYAGQVVMAGFLHRVVPLFLRRSVALVPALLLLSCASPTTVLLWSQVALSIGIPFTLLPLLIFTSRRTVMGPWVNRVATTALGLLISVLIIAINGYLLANLW